MPLIVDTFNVLHVTGVLPPELAGIDVSGLAELIAASRYGRDRVTLVCDGYPVADGRKTGHRRSRGKGVQPSGPNDPALRDGASFGRSARVGSVFVRYSGVGVEADDLIGRMIDHSSAPRSLLVVSTDRRIRAMAARRRSAWLRSEEFLAQLAEDHRRGPPRDLTSRSAPATPLAPTEVLRWARELGLDPDDLDRLPAELVGDLAAEPVAPPQSTPVTPQPAPPEPTPERASETAGTGSTNTTPPRSVRPATDPPKTPPQPPRKHGAYRPLADAEHPEEIDPTELERFDLDRWMRDHHQHGPPPDR